MPGLPGITTPLAEHPGCNWVCRACHYKDIDYPTQLERKRHWARTQLEPWLGVLQEIVPAPASERIEYRSKSWLRSSFDQGELLFGMFRSIRLGSKWGKEFVSWNTCPLHVPAIQQMIERLAQGLVRCAPQFVERSLVGVWVGSPHLVVVSRDPEFGPIRDVDWTSILVPPFDRVWFHCNNQVGRKIFGHERIEAIVGPSAEGTHPIRAFRQVAQGLLKQARSRAVQALLRERIELVLDLYCGTGELSSLIPDTVDWIGIEYSQEAARFAQLLRGKRSLHEAFVGGVEQRLRDPRVLKLIREPYALYLNPPRSGLSPEARDSILALLQCMRPKIIVYLSCSASSLARDLKVLDTQGYRVESLQPYDFFPQTEHFETLAVLVSRC